MVDPNPARGMPLQLQRYWLVGKGAAKIRWHMPHDFDRCVRNLRKYFPKNPEGLCNILHQKAVGAPPGKGHGHALTASFVASDDPQALIAAQKLIDKQPYLGQYTWAGPLAPIGIPTSEPRRTRIFEPGSLSHRVLPRPLDWRERNGGQGHEGSVTVGRILGLTVGPDHMGKDYAWAYGDFLDEEIIPEAKKSRYLAEMGLVEPSLDPGGPVVVQMNPETGHEHYSQFVIGGATLVSVPAYSMLRFNVFDGDSDWPDDDPDYAMTDESEEDCGCGDKKDYTVKSMVAAVNTKGWQGLPLAPREAVFDNDDAVKRITAWAQGGQDTEKMRRAFMYYDPRLSASDPTSYRLPVGDIINGRLTLVYHAIYAAAALLSGAHGGLPNVPQDEAGELRSVISEIYPEMATAFNDSSIRAPWDRSAQPGVQLAMEYAATEPYGDVEYADPGYRDNKKRYPIDTPDHVRAAWSYINQAKNASFYESGQLAAIKARIRAAAKKHGIEISDGDEQAMTNFPVNPPKTWFENPKLAKKTRLTVTDDGHVFGHLAAWGECHRDVTNRECVMAPKSRQGYEPFHLGTVMTAEGEEVTVGKIVMDTRHAAIHLGYTAAAVHYDNTGDEVAVIRCGEDQYGIWFAGSMVPEATPAKVAKLRRSPLSGDWRRERGSLELTAALAVNAPAFPIYSMEHDETTALVAAGTVWYDEEPEYQPPASSIMEDLKAYVDDMFNSEGFEERSQVLADLDEDEEIFAQRQRAARFRHLFAMDAVAAPVAQTAGTAPQQQGAAEAPVAGANVPPTAAPAEAVAGQSGTDAAGMDVEAWNDAAEASGRFVVAVPGIGNANEQQQQQPSFMQGQPVPAPNPAAPTTTPPGTGPA